MGCGVQDDVIVEDMAKYSDEASEDNGCHGELEVGRSIDQPEGHTCVHELSAVEDEGGQPRCRWVQSDLVIALPEVKLRVDLGSGHRLKDIRDSREGKLEALGIFIQYAIINAKAIFVLLKGKDDRRCEL